MARLIEVVSCYKCPYGEVDAPSRVWNLVCTRKRDEWGECTRILSVDIPDWCPLPVAEEARDGTE